MRCTECNGRGETIYFVEIARDEHTVTVEQRKGICRTCNGSGEQPMTNADRIRAMSDQELAAYWAENHDNFCPNKPECGEALDRDELIPDEWCVACALAWLQKPVEEPQLPVRFHMDKQESGLLEE